MQVVGHNGDTLEIKNRKVRVLTVTVSLMNADHATQGSFFFPRNVTMKCTLKRAGEEHILFADNLQNLTVESNWRKGLEAVTGPLGMLYKGAGRSVVPICIQMPGIIDVQGDDLLSVQLNAMTGTYNSLFDINQCKIDFDWTDTKGIEEAIPVITTEYINGGTNNFTKSLGSDVISVLLLNYDQGFGGAVPYRDTQRVFQSVALNSDEYNINEKDDVLQSRNYRLFENEASAHYRGQSFMIQQYHGHHLHNVQLTVQLDATLNTQANNVVMVRKFKYTPETTVRAHAAAKEAADEHVNKMVNRVGAHAVNAAHRARRGHRH